MEQHPTQDGRAPQRTRGTSIPHVTQHDKADITALEALRKQCGPQVETAGGKLTVTAVALKILAGALKKFPQFAASIDTGRGQLVYKKYAHIGVAVDTDRGLLVPVIRDVDTKGHHRARRRSWPRCRRRRVPASCRSTRCRAA